MAVQVPDERQHGLRGDGGRRRHDDQRFPEQRELPEDVQVDQDRLETPEHRSEVTGQREEKILNTVHEHDSVNHQ